MDAQRSPFAAALEEAASQVRANPGLRDLLRAAREWGVPPGRLLGRRTVELVAEYDQAGRLVRWVAPPWPIEDLALVIALQDVEASICDGCGHPLAESTDPVNEGRYRPDLPVRCWACTALGAAGEPYRESPQPQALRFSVRLRILDEALAVAGGADR